MDDTQHTTQPIASSWLHTRRLLNSHIIDMAFVISKSRCYRASMLTSNLAETASDRR